MAESKIKTDDYFDTLRQCDQCGKKVMCAFCEDPYMDEIFPEKENEPSWWCEECHDDACDDI